jgi:hypothetical protein
MSLMNLNYLKYHLNRLYLMNQKIRLHLKHLRYLKNLKCLMSLMSLNYLKYHLNRLYLMSLMLPDEPEVPDEPIEPFTPDEHRSS